MLGAAATTSPHTSHTPHTTHQRGPCGTPDRPIQLASQQRNRYIPNASSNATCEAGALHPAAS